MTKTHAIFRVNTLITVDLLLVISKQILLINSFIQQNFIENQKTNICLPIF